MNKMIIFILSLIYFNFVSSLTVNSYGNSSKIYGTAEPYETITLFISDEKLAVTQADSKGQWSVSPTFQLDFIQQDEAIFWGYSETIKVIGSSGSCVNHDFYIKRKTIKLTFFNSTGKSIFIFLKDSNHNAKNLEYLNDILSINIYYLDGNFYCKEGIIDFIVIKTSYKNRLMNTLSTFMREYLKLESYVKQYNQSIKEKLQTIFLTNNIPIDLLNMTDEYLCKDECDIKLKYDFDFYISIEHSQLKVLNETEWSSKKRTCFIQ